MTIPVHPKHSSAGVLSKESEKRGLAICFRFKPRRVAVMYESFRNSRGVTCVLLAGLVVASEAFSPPKVSLGLRGAAFKGAGGGGSMCRGASQQRQASTGNALLNCRASATLMPGDASSMPAEGGQLAEWRQKLDLKAWGAEIRALESEAMENMGADDLKHLQKMRLWYNAMYVAGVLSAGFCQLPFNPLSAILLSTAICMRWTMIGHHTCHGGYNSLVEPTDRFHRSNFARGGLRRVLDWCDWMLPEAWDVEHNFMHHYMLGETRDPDLLEKNANHVRTSNMPLLFKFITMGKYMLIWKWYYYAPNTLKEMFNRQNSLAAKKEDSVVQPFDLPPVDGDFDGATQHATFTYCVKEMFKLNFAPGKALASILAPYFLRHFVAIPLAFYAFFGQAAAMAALANVFLAEIITNIHSFIIVVPNHAGEDVYRFKTPVKVKSDEFLLRAVIGSVNYRTGGNVNDALHGWLNYQIEHHMWPRMSMLAYQRVAPKVKAVCGKHGVPYVQHNVFYRLWKTMEIGVGLKNMKVWENGD